LLFSPSGGLVYHLRALRYRQTLWQPFCGALEGWLTRHLRVEDELILVGPSAGHCLPRELLGRARSLLVLEPDPVARRLLALKLAPQRFHAEARDLLVAPLLSGRSGLDAVLARWPRATVLFCNVLGQLHFGLKDEQEQQLQTEFRRRILPALQGRGWASFHDRWSLDRGSDDAPAPALLHFERLPSDELLAEAYFGSETVTALDHGTTTLFPERLARDYLPWQITPRALHLIEAVAGGADDPPL